LPAAAGKNSAEFGSAYSRISWGDHKKDDTYMQPQHKTNISVQIIAENAQKK
jgi:hypothetical protein